MLSYSVDLTDEETNLIETIREVIHGEIYSVQISPGAKTNTYQLNDAERSLMIEIRNGMTDISVLHIHEGQPAYAEVDKKVNGLRCRLKVKF